MAPSPVVADTLARVLPVLVFLVAITVVAELSDAAGVFAAAAGRAARLARGRMGVLWLLVVGLGVAATVVLSLDTTAVLLTPVVLTLAVRLGLPPAPLAMTTVWLANTASLLLPVSNLTNLLSLDRMQALGVGLDGYLRLTWAPALAAVVVTVLVLVVLFRGRLRGRFHAPVAAAVVDRPLLTVATVVCLLLGPAFVTGIPVAWPASVGAAVLVAVFAVRDRSALRWSMLPWQLVLGVGVLFVVVQVASVHGLAGLLTRLAGEGNGFVPYLRLATVAAVGANGVDNLPAYLALEPVADDTPARLVALLVGVNTGPLLTMWASLATLLWRQRCRAAGLEVSGWRFAARGLVLVPLVLVAGCAALAAVA
jgi:arsenical pump membrane protein